MSNKAKTKTPSKKEILVSIAIALLLIVLGLLIVVLNNNARTRLDDAGVVTVTGKTLCLESKNTEGPQIDLCAQGIKTESGKVYALGVPAEIKDEDTISATGVIKPASPDDQFKSDGIITKP